MNLSFRAPIFLLAATLSASNLLSADLPKEPGQDWALIEIPEDYNHTKFGIDPSDKLYHFAAFTSSFDTLDDNDGGDDLEVWGIPEWVACEIKGGKERHKLQDRPRWMHDKSVPEGSYMPRDDSYAVSGTRQLKSVKTDYRFVRGHLCSKFIAERISEAASYNTHVMMNAVPQLQWQNAGIWLDLEEATVDWADQFGQVWVVCGPVFFGREPAMWLGQDDEVRIAVPDALFKVVVREDEAVGVVAVAFVLPNILPKSYDDFWEFAVSVDEVEELTGLDFLPEVEDEVEEVVEAVEFGSAAWLGCPGR